jgi:hypothetical protein
MFAEKCSKIVKTAQSLVPQLVPQLVPLFPDKNPEVLGQWPQINPFGIIFGQI